MKKLITNMTAKIAWFTSLSPGIRILLLFPYFNLLKTSTFSLVLGDGFFPHS